MTELARWLNEQGLGALKSTFEENDVDFDVLQELTDDELKELGISLGNRKKLRKALSGRRESLSASIQATPLRSTTYVPERRHITVVFCDLVGSSLLAAKLDPEEMRDLLKSYQDVVSGEIARFDGHIAQFLGDGVLAYFGWPRAHEDAGERGVRAGLAAVASVSRLPAASGESLGARVGIATGLVVVGELAAQDGSAVGETPNLAARLQGLADSGAVVIDPNTRRLVGNVFECEDRGLVELKGFAKPVQVSLVLREKTTESRFEATRASMLTPLVGRDAEISILAERWQQAKDGEGQVVLLCSEPGMGKSRMVETLHQQVAADAPRRLRYQCSPFFANTALYPFVEQIERVARLHRDDTPEVKLGKVEALFAETGIADEDLQLLAAMLSIPTGHRFAPLELSPQRQKEKLIHSLAARIVDQSRHMPVVFIFEDAHWSDPTSIEALSAVIEAVPHARVLALITHRAEFKPAWSGHSHVTTHTINRLARRQGAAMVDRITGGKPLPPEVMAQIVEKSDGIPLFVEELTKTVIESGLVVERSGRYVLDGPLTPLAIPATLQDSLMARLDRLAPVKETAQTGAALGREFSYELISLVSPLQDNELGDGLRQLVQSELIHVRGNAPDAIYTFKHALIQDAAYQTLLKARRLQLHLKIAKTLEEHFPQTGATEPELLAHHYTEASLPGPAIDYWAKAGRRAMENSAYAEAIAHLRKGLTLVASLPTAANPPEQELMLLNLLATPLMNTMGYATPEVRQVYERAHHLSETIGGSVHIFQAICGISTYHMAQGELRRALELSEEMLRLAEANGDHGAILESHRLTALNAAWSGQFKKSRFHSNRVYELFDPGKDRPLAYVYGQDLKMSAFVIATQAEAALGFPDTAVKLREHALRESQLTTHIYSRAYARSWSLHVYYYTRDIEKMRLAQSDAVNYSRDQSILFWRICAEMYMAWLLLQDGDYENSIIQMRGAMDFLAMTGTIFRMPMSAILAEALFKKGEVNHALDELDRSLEIMTKQGEMHYEAESHRLKGDFLLEGKNDSDSAEKAYLAALAIANGQEAKLFELRAATSLAKLWHRNGRRNDAWNLLSGIHSWFTEGFDLPDLRDARKALAQLEAWPIAR